MIEIRKAGRHTGYVFLPAREHLDVVHRLGQQVAHGHEVLMDPSRGNAEHDLFRVVHRVLDVFGDVVRLLRDDRRCVDQAAKRRVVGDDARVIGGICRDRNGRDQRVEVRLSSDGFELSSACQLIGNGDRVGRFPL